MMNNVLIIIANGYVSSMDFSSTLHVPAASLNGAKRTTNSFHMLVSKLRPRTYASPSTILSISHQTFCTQSPPTFPRNPHLCPMQRLHFPNSSESLVRNRQATLLFRGHLSKLRRSDLVPLKICSNFDKRCVV